MITESVDAVVVGAGPSGCCVSLRLRSMGYRVALVESRAFPRPQIGESLSPGIWNILDYIDAADTINEAGFLRDLPARVVWESRSRVLIAAEDRGPGIMVDRAEFDAGLLALVQDRGARLIQPAKVRRIDGEPGAWRVRVTGPGQECHLETRLVLDARGRAVENARSRFPTAPTTLALWAHVAGNILPHETRIEALCQGWLWGSPLPSGQYRVMAFLDPSSLTRSGGLESVFRGLLTGSTLFESAADAIFLSPLRTCSATPYIDLESWRPGQIKLGENACALDPLSSSGVEKSMRLALQAAIAANTLLRDPGTAGLARDFYESRLIDSAATHSVWTRDYYARAWPGAEHAFWHDRSSAPPESSAEQPELIERLHEACARRVRIEADRARKFETRFGNHEEMSSEALRRLPRALVSLSPKIRFIDAACVVDDRVQLRPAVAHPALEEPLVFLAGCEIVPLLQITHLAQDLGQLVALWSSFIPAETAARIAGWLRQHGLLLLLES